MKVNIILNPIFEEGDKPGQFLEFAVQVPDDVEDMDRAITQQIANKLVWRRNDGKNSGLEV